MLATHRAWAQAQDADARKRLQQILHKLENYKIAVQRNVSPAIVVETALMGLSEQIQIF